MQEVLITLAVWRAGLFIIHDRAPFRVMDRLRAVFRPLHSELDYLLTCMWCISLWLGLGACAAFGLPAWQALAFSAGAIALDRIAS
jgi:hypothetical protein